MKLWVPNPASVEFSGSIPTNSRVSDFYHSIILITAAYVTNQLHRDKYNFKSKEDDISITAAAVQMAHLISVIIDFQIQRRIKDMAR